MGAGGQAPRLNGGGGARLVVEMFVFPSHRYIDRYLPFARVDKICIFLSFPAVWDARGEPPRHSKFCARAGNALGKFQNSGKHNFGQKPQVLLTLMKFHITPFECCGPRKRYNLSMIVWPRRGSRFTSRHRTLQIAPFGQHLCR